MSTASYRRLVQPLRYRVTYWEDSSPDVSYHCSLGAAVARRHALYNARNYGGIVWCEYTDGTSERIDTAVFGQPVLPSDAAKAA